MIASIKGLLVVPQLPKERGKYFLVNQIKLMVKILQFINDYPLFGAS